MNFAQYDSEQRSYTHLVVTIKAKGHPVTGFDNEIGGGYCYVIVNFFLVSVSNFYFNISG